MPPDRRVELEHIYQVIGRSFGLGRRPDIVTGVGPSGRSVGDRIGRYERHVYPGTQHGFNNDTTPRYDAAAAKLAWDRTLAHFSKHLR